MMSGPEVLQTLPAELIHIITEWLSLDDVKTLRLVCRQLASKAVGRRFIGALELQTTDLTRESLSSLEALTRHETLGPLVRHVRVMANSLTAYDTARYVARVRQDGHGDYSSGSDEQYSGDEWHESSDIYDSDPSDSDTPPGVDSPPNRPSSRRYGSPDLNNHLRAVIESRRQTFNHFFQKMRKEREETLTWMRAREANPDAMTDAQVVERLASILSWNGRGSLHTLDLVARFVSGPGKLVEPLQDSYTPTDRQRLWVRASQVYRLTMTALARSGAAIPNLYIYSRTPGCSVPSYDITVGLPGLIDAGLGTAGASIETLELSFSTRVDHGWRGWEQAYGADLGRRERATQRQQWKGIFDKKDYVVTYNDAVAAEQGDDGGSNDGEEDGDGASDDDLDAAIEGSKGSKMRGRYRDDYPQPLCRANVPGIASLLLHMPNLQVLDLHMFQTLKYKVHPGVSRLHHHERIFGALVSRRVSLPMLRRLSLRGLIFTSQDLVSFLGSHRAIEDLELCNVYLSEVGSPEVTWQSTLKEALASPPPAKAPAGRPRLSRLLLSVLLYQGSAQAHLRDKFPPVNLQPRGEPPRGDLLSRDWGGACPCGNGASLWTREFDRDELAGPAPFDFVGRDQETCRLRARGHSVSKWSERGVVVAEHRKMYGLA